MELGMWSRRKASAKVRRLRLSSPATTMEQAAGHAVVVLMIREFIDLADERF